jgi:hypothetical protein
MKLKALPIAAVIGLATSIGASQAATLLEVDLSVTDQLTITATNGLASVSAGGDAFTGFYLDNILGTAISFQFDDEASAGDLTSLGDTPNDTPWLFVPVNGSGLGVNVYDYVDGDTISVTAGEIAFEGSATWDITSELYNSLLAGPSLGSIFLPADTLDDIIGMQSIGEWAHAGAVAPVPLPAGGLLLSTALLGFGWARTRRKVYS